MKYHIGFRWFVDCRDFVRSLRLNGSIKHSTRPQRVINMIDTNEWTFKGCRVIVKHSRPKSVWDIVKKFN